jgi:hypothetical protein
MPRSHERGGRRWLASAGIRPWRPVLVYHRSAARAHGRRAACSHGRSGRGPADPGAAATASAVAGLGGSAEDAGRTADGGRPGRPGQTLLMAADYPLPRRFPGSAGLAGHRPGQRAVSRSAGGQPVSGRVSRSAGSGPSAGPSGVASWPSGPPGPSPGWRRAAFAGGVAGNTTPLAWVLPGEPLAAGERFTRVTHRTRGVARRTGYHAEEGAAFCAPPPTAL